MSDSVRAAGVLGANVTSAAETLNQALQAAWAAGMLVTVDVRQHNEINKSFPLPVVQVLTFLDTRNLEWRKPR